MMQGNGDVKNEYPIVIECGVV